MDESSSVLQIVLVRRLATCNGITRTGDSSRASVNDVSIDIGDNSAWPHNTMLKFLDRFNSVSLFSAQHLVLLAVH